MASRVPSKFTGGPYDHDAAFWFSFWVAALNISEMGFEFGAERRQVQGGMPHRPGLAIVSG